MKNKSLVPLLAALVCSALSSQFSICDAQGTAITYQGRLTDGGPNANGAYDFTFQLFDAASGGTSQSATLTTNGVSLADGLFNVALDFGSAPFSLGAARWLEIKVRTNGAASFGTIIPRQQVTATPYAIVAAAVTGPVSSTSLAGNYSNAVNFANGANSFRGSFVGDGAGITNLNPALLNGLVNSNSWQLGGNSGTTSGTNFMGTTDNQPLEIKVNGLRALRLEPNSTSPNVIGGYVGNLASNAFHGTFIGGGGDAAGPNLVGNNYASVLGGRANKASGLCATAIGYGNTASGDFSSAMGAGNIASGNASTAQGDFSIASGTAATALGESSVASGNGATALGDTSLASGTAATAMGAGSVAAGNFSFAAGLNAHALGHGSFVWSDSFSFTDFGSSASNVFLIRATGGVGIGLTNPAAALDVNGTVRATSFSAAFSSTFNGLTSIGSVGIGTNSPQQKLHVIGNILASGTITGSSDRNVKERFTAVNPREVLDKVSALPITEWSYQADEGVRHLGPMAQDFYSAFAVGMDDKHISMVDADGVALAAIQGLNQRLDEKDLRIRKLEKRLDKLEQLLNRNSNDGHE